MNCPACNAPLFGATVCGCGYAHTRRLSTIDLSYPEALLAYWRIYWPAQLFGIIGYLPFQAWLRVPGRTYFLQANRISTAELLFLQTAFSGAIGLFLFVHRVFSFFRIPKVFYPIASGLDRSESHRTYNSAAKPDLGFCMVAANRRWVPCDNPCRAVKYSYLFDWAAERARKSMSLFGFLCWVQYSQQDPSF